MSASLFMYGGDPKPDPTMVISLAEFVTTVPPMEAYTKEFIPVASVASTQATTMNTGEASTDIGMGDDVDFGDDASVTSASSGPATEAQGDVPIEVPDLGNSIAAINGTDTSNPMDLSGATAMTTTGTSIPATTEPDDMYSSITMGGSLVACEKPPEACKEIAVLTLNTSVCADETKGPNEPCSGCDILAVLSKYVKMHKEELIGKKKIPQVCDNTTVNEAAALTGCHDEPCVLSHPDVSKLMKENGVKVDEKLFKTPGPRYTVEWLSNSHIEGKLKEWMEIYPEFAFYECTLMDFNIDKYAGLGDKLPRPTLGTKSVYSFGPEKTIIACVVNTGKGESRGIHWVVLLVDMKNPKLHSYEYFNSVGHAPTPEIIEWTKKHMDEAPEGVKTVVKHNTVPMQNGNSECGVYSLYFIRKRLEGYTFAEICTPQASVPDDAIAALRRYLFSPETSNSEKGKRGAKKGGSEALECSFELLDI